MSWLQVCLMVPAAVDQVKAVAPLAPFRPIHHSLPCSSPEDQLPSIVDLAGLWDLALKYNPRLKEAAAELDRERGRHLQASLYPNPQVTYEEEDLGTGGAPAGTIRVQLTQEIVTGGKRFLDIAVAARRVDAAALGLEGQRFEVLTTIRRDYGEFLGWHYTVLVNDEVVRALENGKAITRELVEKAKTRPPTDLLRLETLLEEARINRLRSGINRQAAWRQLAAAIGLPDLPCPTRVHDLPGQGISGDSDTVLHRVLSAHTDIQKAAVDVERCRLALKRAHAEAIPNVTVGGGYSNNFPEHESGAIITFQSRLPLWDRNQGNIAAARAELAQAQAVLQDTVLRLYGRTADAEARYRGARQELQRLQHRVVPRVRESLKLVEQGYRTGSAQFTFADVLLAQQTLNETELRIAQMRRELWRALADLQGLMQLDLGQKDIPTKPSPEPCR
jgi:cobalt-zinc-cadmium efflux system outer membrane protein